MREKFFLQEFATPDLLLFLIICVIGSFTLFLYINGRKSGIVLHFFRCLKKYSSDINLLYSNYEIWIENYLARKRQYSVINNHLWNFNDFFEFEIFLLLELSFVPLLKIWIKFNIQQWWGAGSLNFRMKKSFFNPKLSLSWQWCTANLHRLKLLLMNELHLQNNFHWKLRIDGK